MSSESEEENEVASDKMFVKAHYHMKKAQDIMESEVIRVRQEKEALDSVAKKLEHVHFSSTVKLNVGGQIFTTSLETLTKDAGSMLHAMFSGRFDTKPAEDGSYFIDRDGTCFRYILNYLRTDKLLLPEDKLIQNEVLEEARFYQIQGIIDELDAKPPKLSKSPNFSVELYSDSTILSPNQSKWLVAVTLSGFVKHSASSLLYRGSRDGWGSPVFHSKCDNAGPTMVVIKSTGGYIFGGYTERSWAGFGYNADRAAFIFSLIRRGGTNPVQMKVHQNLGDAIGCNNSFGPTFGGGHDLMICSNPQSNNCSTNIGHTYLLPSGESGTTFLTGGQYFNVAELEVFGLKE